MRIALLAALASAAIAGWSDWRLGAGFIAGALTVYVLFGWHYGWWPDFNVSGRDDENSQRPRLEGERNLWD